MLTPCPAAAADAMKETKNNDNNIKSYNKG
jgi:hypothetical protein